MAALPPDQCAIQRTSITKILNGARFPTARIRNLAVLNFILHTEIAAGTSFMSSVDGNIYIYLGMINEIMLLPDARRGGDRILAYLNQGYGISQTDLTGKFAYASLRDYAISHSTKTDLRRFAVYNTTTNTAYLSNYNGRMWKLDGGTPELMNNGDDDVFFADDDGGVSIDPDFGPNGILLDKLTDLNFTDGLGGITPAQQKMALTVWIFMLAFPDMMPTKPLLILEGAAGAGKCLGRGTGVIMFDGTVRAVETVRVGELLMGPDGLPRTVLSTTAGRGPLYRVIPVKGEPWVCNDAHVLSLVSNARTDADVVNNISAKEFTRLTAWRQTSLKQFSVGVDRFNHEAPLPVDPYFLGVWFGDGTKALQRQRISGDLKIDGGLTKVTITKPDPEIRQLCEETAKAWNLRVSTSSDGLTHSLVSDEREGRWIRNRLLEALRDLVGPEIIVPSAYLRASKEVRLQLLAGFLDTDGDLSSGCCFNITQKREDWARAVWWLARSVGLQAVMSTRVGRCPRADGSMFEGKYWRVSISGDTDMIPTRIPRKQATARQQVKEATRTGITLEAIGDGEFFGFTLDGDHRFLLEDFTVTHNSASVQLLQLALLGVSKPMILSKNKEDDFGVLLLRSPIAVFDNTDSYIEWVPDAICAYTTLGYWVKRKLFSDASEVQIRPHAFIAIASKNPASFRREDVADRCVILRLERRAQFKKFQELQREIAELRPQLLGEYMWYVNEIISVIRAQQGSEVPEETTRMADFAAFARVVGEVLKWDPADIVGLMDALGRERDAFVNEEDSLVELLHHWIVYRGGGFSNIGRPRSLFELHAELESMSQIHTLPYYKTARLLAQKIRSPHISRDFDVQLDVSGGKKVYTIWRKTDPRLGVVPDDDEDEGIKFT